MRSSEKVEGTPRARNGKSNGASSHGHGRRHAKASIQGVMKMGRGLSHRLQHDLETHPEALLVAVGGASFLAGAILGSRLGRLILSAAIPFGVQSLVESEVAPRLRSYVQDLLRHVDAPEA